MLFSLEIYNILCNLGRAITPFDSSERVEVAPTVELLPTAVEWLSLRDHLMVVRGSRLLSGVILIEVIEEEKGHDDVINRGDQLRLL